MAKKADEFSMQPSLATWQGVEKSIAKTQAIQTYWKIGVLSLSIVAIIGILFIQDTKNSASNQNSEAGISLLAPLTNKSLPHENKDQAGSPEISSPIQQVSPEISLSVQRPNPETEKTPINPSDFQEISIHKNEKIVLKALEPKDVPFEVYFSPLTRFPNHGRIKGSPGRKSRDGWYVQANYGPAYAYRNISSRTDYARPLEDSKKRLDKGISGFTTRVQARYHFSERFSLAFGLGYTRSGERIGMAPKKSSKVYDALAEEYGYETSEMNALGDVSYFTNEYNYAEIPLTLYSRKPLSPRLSLTTGLGISLGYMVSTNARCYDYRVDHYVNNKKFYRDWTLTSHAQLLFEYSLNTRWALAAGPELTYALLSTYRNYYTLSQHQFSVGMNFGVQWKLFDVTKSRLAD